MIDQYIRKYGKRLYGLCLTLCANPFDADDLYQDTWLQVVRNISRYDEMIIVNTLFFLSMIFYRSGFIFIAYASYKKYGGQAVIYTITMNDGTEITVNAYNPFIIIDGIGYKTKYEPCERLSQIANELAK